MARLSLSPSQVVGGARAKDATSTHNPPPRFLDETEDGDGASWEDDYKAWEEKCVASKVRKKRNAPTCALDNTAASVEGDGSTHSLIEYNLSVDVVD